jgi:xylose isomerase
LQRPREERYAGWSHGIGTSILSGELTLEALEEKVASGEIDPKPKSGGQELLENQVNQRIWATPKT